MIAEIIKEDIPSIQSGASIGKAIELLQNEDISELVVTDEERYVYMIREIDIISSLRTTISEITTEREGHFVYNEEHFFRALQKIHSNDLSILPVVNKEMKYQGAIRKDRLLDYLCEGYSIAENESIIIIEQAARDYSLAALSRIIEQEGGKVLGVFTAPAQNSNEKIWLSLTLSTSSIQKIVSSLERHEYSIIAHMSGEENETMIKERYESLMTFLNV